MDNQTLKILLLILMFVMLLITSAIYIQTTMLWAKSSENTFKNYEFKR